MPDSTTTETPIAIEETTPTEPSTATDGDTASLFTSPPSPMVVQTSRYTCGPGSECRTPSSPPSLYSFDVWEPKARDGLRTLGIWYTTPLAAAKIPASPRRQHSLSSLPREVANVARTVRHYPSLRTIPENTYFSTHKATATKST